MCKSPQNNSAIDQTLGLSRNPNRNVRFKPAFVLLCVLLALFSSYLYRQAWLRARFHLFEVAKARRGDLTVIVTAMGTLQPVKTVEVGAEISGRIERAPVDFNAHVRRGEALAAYLDGSPARG
jgi:HlyD family secretion protein